jgi:hypothetical protein
MAWESLVNLPRTPGGTSGVGALDRLGGDRETFFVPDAYATTVVDFILAHCDAVR